MTVKQLRGVLEGLPGNTKVVVHHRNNRYRDAVVLSRGMQMKMVGVPDDHMYAVHEIGAPDTCVIEALVID